ncbi:RND transporter [Haloferax sp. Atlit-6N]|uniref:efflux RND transporter permease subunit n=1 Tax=Haloferax sp. Atlit-6N TaxID=2077205 RepID=UPI000E277054|nr:MMPL family transporter [Haloferax sp. Atlit-6N]REA02050.1 RND transporter [Haloferax sp. Atlit-6N]
MVDYQTYIDTIDDWIVNRSRRVIISFLVLTLVFTAGLGGISTDSGTEQFTNDIPAQEALDDINDDFRADAFATGSGSTQLIQTAPNVLSKEEQLRMLRAQYRLEQHSEMRVASTTAVARAVAQTLDPSATTLEAQVNAMEQASNSEVRAATRTALQRNPALQSSLSKDLNVQSVSATATIGVVQHNLGTEASSTAGTSGSSPLTPIQLQAKEIVSSVGGDIRVFGSGIVSAEFGNVIGDSLLLVVPAAVLLIVGFLVISYRDPFDLFLGIVSLTMAIIWTFGFMGLAGIPFTQMLIAVPPLLLAVGIDFGIHAINRYREERVEGHGVVNSMRTATDQLLVAFAIVTGTTVIGFAANITSDLPPIQDFGLVAAIGIIFTFLIFGIFLPAAKVSLDNFREAHSIPMFAQNPIGSEDSILGKILPVGVKIGQAAPAIFLALVLISTVWVGNYGLGVESSFSQEDFLPPEDTPGYLENLPEPFAPGTYTVTGNINYLEDNFESGQGDSVTIYVQGPLYKDTALEGIAAAGENPPESFVTDGQSAEETSIITVIDEYAAESPEFAALVARNDINDNGIPDDNLRTIYDELLSSPYGDRARQYITSDYRSAQVVYTVESDAKQAAITNDATAIADRYRFTATATGSIVVLKAVSDVIANSALVSMALALALTGAFLILAYHVLERKGSLGIVNLVPIAVTIALIAGTMRYYGIPFNALTGTILSIAIGLGVDYSAHTVHRFAEEYREHDGDVFVALNRTVRGTGGALTMSMLTTVTGIGVLVIAITPVLGQFGLLTGVSILYSYLTSLIVLPPALVLWDRYLQPSPANQSIEHDSKSI